MPNYTIENRIDEIELYGKFGNGYMDKHEFTITRGILDNGIISKFLLEKEDGRVTLQSNIIPPLPNKYKEARIYGVYLTNKGTLIPKYITLIY